MEKKAFKAKNQERVGLIDGVPNSFNVNYVLASKRNCASCSRYFKQKDITLNQIICTEEGEFYHKNCVAKAGLEIKHQRPDDRASIIKLVPISTDASK